MTTASLKTKTRPKKTAESSLISKKMPEQPATSVEPQNLGPARRLEMISVAAYYIAEKNGFNPNMTEVNWILAEKQIDNIQSN